MLFYKQANPVILLAVKIYTFLRLLSRILKRGSIFFDKNEQGFYCDI
jgi:hypothetical protein